MGWLIGIAIIVAVIDLFLGDGKWLLGRVTEAIYGFPIALVIALLLLVYCVVTGQSFDFAYTYGWSYAGFYATSTALSLVGFLIGIAQEVEKRLSY